MPVSRMRMRPGWRPELTPTQSVDLCGSIRSKRCSPYRGNTLPVMAGKSTKMLVCSSNGPSTQVNSGRGVTPPDPKTWKANFRCAMNSLPDIEEVKDKSINKGCGAVRVYRMLPAVNKKKDKRSKSRDSRRRTKLASKDKMQVMDTDGFTHIQEETVTQENTIDSTEHLSTASPTVDVPEVSGYEVEIGPDSTNDIYTTKFQVSPVHSTELEEEENEAIIEISRQLERDSSQWLQNNFIGKGFLSNEAGTTESFSPESQWSESSGEELEFRLYTELNPGLPEDPLYTYTEMWNSSAMPQIMCPL